MQHATSLRVAGLAIAVLVAIAAAPPVAAPVQSGAALAPLYGYRVVNAYPHDSRAFTQGLVYREGWLYESTGLRGRSTLRKVELATGQVVKEHRLDPKFFAEGLADWGGQLIQLTWTTNVGFVYDLNTFRQVSSFAYGGEGWGLARERDRLVMSDGSPRLRFLDPRTLREVGHVTVHDGKTPVTQLNELEVVKDEVYANVWQTDRIARINSHTGKVVGWIDLAGLLPQAERRDADVLNGIAYDPVGDRLFVTGKLWPRLYEIKLERRFR